MFTEEFLESLPADPIEALFSLCTQFRELTEDIPTSEYYAKYDEFLEAYATFEAFIDTFDLEFHVPSLGDNKDQNIGLIFSYVQQTFNAIEKGINDEKFS